jgi:hypothetical protein
MNSDETTMTDDEEYEAKLQARTPEEWAAMMEKAKTDMEAALSLQSLWWGKDAKDWEYLAKQMGDPDSTLADHDYALRQMGEIADRLRAARDNPEQRERERWRDLTFAAAMIGSSNPSCAYMWLKQAKGSFPAVLGPAPADDAPLLDHATYAVESLLDALLMDPEDRAKLEGKMRSWFRQWAGENGIRMGVHNANGEFELLGEVIPFRNGQEQQHKGGADTDTR